MIWQQPGMVALEAQIAHSERRLRSANDLAATVRKDEEKQQEKVNRLRNELDSVQKAANTAQGNAHRLLQCLASGR